MDAKETLVPCTSFPFEKIKNLQGHLNQKQLYINTALMILTVIPVHNLKEDYKHQNKVHIFR